MGVQRCEVEPKTEGGKHIRHTRHNSRKATAVGIDHRLHSPLHDVVLGPVPVRPHAVHHALHLPAGRAHIADVNLDPESTLRGFLRFVGEHSIACKTGVERKQAMRD